MPRNPFELAGASIAPGQRQVIDIPLSMMSDHTPASLSIQVIHGKRPGPTLFVSAAIHGDEVIGVEIIRRLVGTKALNRIAGTLLLIPIVNTFGFIGRSRYLPDRRDLNRSFPGNSKGSLAARLANLFMAEIVSRCDYGIDLHSAAIHRTNLPQLRIDAADEKAAELAKAFAPPVILNASFREGSLRHAASLSGVPVLVFEAGEALRIDEMAVRVGLSGVLRAMRHLGMISKPRSAKTGALPSPPITLKSSWMRADDGGILRARCHVGDFVEKDVLIGQISDPFGGRETDVRASFAGLVVGAATLPVVNQGDALFHIATLPIKAGSENVFEIREGSIELDPWLDDDLVF